MIEKIDSVKLYNFFLISIDTLKISDYILIKKLSIYLKNYLLNFFNKSTCTTAVSAQNILLFLIIFIYIVKSK